MEPVSLDALRFSYALQSLITAIKRAGGDISSQSIDRYLKMSILEFLTEIAVPNYIRFDYHGSDRLLGTKIGEVFTSIEEATAYLKQKKGQ